MCALNYTWLCPIAQYVGSENVPNSLVDKSSFRNLLKVMDPRYPVPRPRKLINKLFMMMKVAIQEHNVCNSRTLHHRYMEQKGLLSSYLGITTQPIPLSAVSCEIYKIYMCGTTKPENS